MAPPLTIAVAQQKGGVGKTTTTANLAHAGSRAGARVLAIDLDPQGNLTRTLYDQEIPEGQPITADVLTEDGPAPLADVIVSTAWSGLDLAPTVDRDLAAVERDLTQNPRTPARVKLLHEAIQASEVAAGYDVVLIDCPPNIGALTLAALAAADRVLAVTEPTLFSADALVEIEESVARVRQHYQVPVTLSAVLINKWRSNVIEDRHWRLSLAEQFGDLVLDPPVPQRVIISRAIQAGVSLSQMGADAKPIADLYDRHYRTLTA